MSFLKKTYHRICGITAREKIQDKTGVPTDGINGDRLVELLYLPSDEYNLRIIDRYEYADRTFVQRLNLIWVWLLTALLSPFRYVMYGQSGWDRFSPVGKWVLKLIGEPLGEVTADEMRERANSDCWRTLDQLSSLEASDFLFGGYTNVGEYELVDLDKGDNKLWWQRLNMFWVLPFVIVTSPVRYVITGESCLGNGSKFGRWLIRIVGE